MLDYMAESLIRFQHNYPKKQQDQPHPHIKPKYREKVQYAEKKYPSLLLGKDVNVSSRKSHAPSYITQGRLIVQFYQH